MITVLPSRGSCLICSARPKPSTSGMWASVSTSGNGSPDCMRRAAAPRRRAATSATTVGVPFANCGASRRGCRRLVALSSTTRTRTSRRTSGSIGAAAPPARRSASPKRSGEVERAAAAHLALHPDPPAHQVDQPRRRWPDPSPVPPNRRVVVPSACSNMSKISRLLVRRDADARVGDGESAARPRPADADWSSTSSTTSPRSVNLIGVSDQVDHHLPQAVAGHRAKIVAARRRATWQASSSPLPCARTASDFIVSPRHSRTSNARRFAASSLPASIFEKSRMSLMITTSDSAESADRRQVLLLLRRQWRVEHQFGHADDGVHGRADLVAHVGQELALAALAVSAASLARLNSAVRCCTRCSNSSRARRSDSSASLSDRDVGGNSQHGPLRPAGKGEGNLRGLQDVVFPRASVNFSSGTKVDRPLSMTSRSVAGKPSRSFPAG